MRILIGTDSFPPACGGSGWSTYELCRALRARGHQLVIVRPAPGRPGDSQYEYDGFTVRDHGFVVPAVPYVRNYFKNERLYARLSVRLARIISDEDIEVVHAQHVMTTPPAVTAARAKGVPAICTVRDYWPVCYWSTILLNPDSGELCPGCSAGMMTRCLRPRAGAAWAPALAMIPYMRANLAAKRGSLVRADAVVAVASAIARDLVERVPELDRARLHVIPNPVDAATILQTAVRQSPPLDGPYVLYVGKLASNKGVGKLWQALAAAKLRWPLVIVGDGPERQRLEADAARYGGTVRFTGWLPRADVLGWMAHASLLVYPSHGPESLSRVLIESAALGLPIAAMDTGGTGDIVRHEETGLLSSSARQLGEHVARLADDRALAVRLGDAARRHVTATFEAQVVAGKMGAVYRQVLAGKSGPPS